jgi:plasmid stabilization system protein ParE
MLFKEDDKYVLSKQSAENEVKKIFDYYEIDLDDIEDKDQKKFIKQNFDRLIKAARLGRLSVNTDDGIKITQVLRSSGEKVEYQEISGKAKTATAGKQADDFYGRIYAIQGVTSQLGEAAIKDMKGVDLSLCEVLGAIFLSV